MGIFFNLPMQAIDTSDTPKALRTLENMVRSMQDQLEFTLANLDSSNVTEIDTGVTNVTGGGVSITGDEINLAGKNGERFRVGVDKSSGIFRFEVTDKSGNRIMYLSSDGALVIAKGANISIDGGEW